MEAHSAQPGILTASLAGALLTFAILERRARRDG